jgi:hypothetical protein
LEKQKPHSIRIFVEQLRGYTIDDEHEDSSCDVWKTFGRSLTKRGFPAPIAYFLTIRSEEERERTLRKIVQQSKISPALLSMLLPTQTEKQLASGKQFKPSTKIDP